MNQTPTKAKDYEGTIIVVNGEEVPIDKSWTEAQIQAAAQGAAQAQRARASAAAKAQPTSVPVQAAPAQATVSQAAPAQVPSPKQGGGFFGTAVDLAKQGFGELSGALHGIGAVGDEVLHGDRPLGQVFTQASTEAKKATGDILGTKGYTSGNRFIDAGTKALGDPTNAVGGLPKAGAKVVAPLVRNLFGTWLGAGGAETARDFAEQGGAGTAGQLAAGIGGGMAANMGVGAVASRALPGLVGMAVEKFGPLVGFKQAAGAADRRVAANVQQKLDRNLASAATENPDLGTQLEQATAEARRLGITDPIPSQVAVPSGSMQSMTSKAGADPAFRRSFEERRQSGMDTTRAAAEKTFGARSDAEGALSSLTSKAVEAAPAVEARLEKLKTERKVLAEEFLGKSASTQTELGAKLRALDQATEKEARAKMSEQYSKVINDADERGVAVNAGTPQADALAEIVQAVRSPEGADIFRTNMKLNQIMRKIDERTTNTPDGAPILNATELTALKEGTREALDDARKSGQAANVRYATQVREMVRGNRDGSVPGLLDKVDPNFGAGIRQADNEFRDTVAGPFGSAEATKLSRAQFMSDVVTRVLSKDEIALGYMARNDATGDHAKSLVREALLHDLSTRSKGELTPRVLEAWKLRNKAAIEQSGLAKDVDSFSGAQAASLKAEADLSEQFQGNIKRDILASMDGGKAATKEIDPEQFVQSLRSDPRKLAGFLRQYNNTDGPKAVQSIYLDSLLNAANPTEVLARDLRSNPQLKALLGPYMKRVEFLAESMERFSKKLPGTADPQSLVPKDKLDERFGVSAGQVVMKARERIGALSTRLFALASMGNATRAERELTKQQGLLLLDNDRITAALKAVEAANKAAPGEAEQGLKTVLDIVQGGARGALKEGTDVGKTAARQGLTQGPKATLNEVGTAPEDQQDSTAQAKAAFDSIPAEYR